ncbi:MAG: purine-nucleoside phosphorylase [Clostridia bacterium]|nr:purine-nucleoside phosphorylase [Clostridia bacterium]
MATPHIKAELGDFAGTVLMPGDPLRSEFIAKTFFDSPRLINNVRGVQGYTGTYKGVPVSVMASGMGMPSMGIYSYELFKFFGVENIIRVGSIGSMNEKVNLRDIILGEGACTNSNYGANYNLPGTFAPIADFTLLRCAAEAAEEKKLNYHVGNILSSDTFYNDESDLEDREKSLAKWNKMGVLGVEMEAAALYMNAARLGGRALAICTVSDSLVTGEATTSDERQSSFTEMMELALEVAVRMDKNR